MLFTNVTDLREIENDFSFLSPEQIAAIRTFWSSFYPKGDTAQPGTISGGLADFRLPYIPICGKRLPPKAKDMKV